jgi:hypothetical protein
MKLKSELENELLELALQLCVDTKNSDVCLRAIRKIQELEDKIEGLTAKTRRPL